MADLLVVEELLVRYGPITAVRGVSLRVQQGEIVALLGANGAGKSSFLNAVGGLVPVAGGRVLFRDELVSRLPPERIVARGLGLTPGGGRAAGPGEAAREPRARARAVPRPLGSAQPGRRHALGGRAEDAGDRPLAHGPSLAPHA